jgi:hypothetical protein
MGGLRNVPVTRDGKRAGFLTVVKELPGVYRTGGGRWFFIQTGHVWTVKKRNENGMGHHIVGTGFASLSYAVSSIMTDEKGGKE